MRALAARSNPALVLEAPAGFNRRRKNRALALTELRLGPEVTFEGFILAPPARASLRPALEAPALG